MALDERRILLTDVHAHAHGAEGEVRASSSRCCPSCSASGRAHVRELGDEFEVKSDALKGSSTPGLAAPLTHVGLADVATVVAAPRRSLHRQGRRWRRRW